METWPPWRLGVALQSIVAPTDADELGELLHVFGSAPRDKHVVGQVIDMVPHPDVGT